MKFYGPSTPIMKFTKNYIALNPGLNQARFKTVLKRSKVHARCSFFGVCASPTLFSTIIDRSVGYFSLLSFHKRMNNHVWPIFKK